MTDQSKEDTADNANKKPKATYFDLSDAVDEVKTEFANGYATDKAKSGAKLVGKALFNVGLFTGNLGWQAVKAAPGALETYSNEIRQLKLKYEGLHDDELISLVHSDGFFGKSAKEKGVAFGVLKSRGLSVDDINSRKG